MIVDSVLIQSESLSSAKKGIKVQNHNSALRHINTLHLQGLSISTVIENVKSTTISLWAKTIESLPSPLFCFVRKGLQQQLATASNLRRWGKVTSDTCPLCKQIQTNKHALSNCSAPSALHRYKLRHDAVLFILCNWLKSVLLPDSKLYADIVGYEPLANVFASFRPDITVVRYKTVHVCELTVCHETNLTKSRDYKLTKYADLNLNLTEDFQSFNVKIETVEVSVFGFMSDISDFTKLTTNSILPDSIRSNIIRNVIGNSYNVYLNRNAEDSAIQ